MLTSGTSRVATGSSMSCLMEQSSVSRNKSEYGFLTSAVKICRVRAAKENINFRLPFLTSGMSMFLLLKIPVLLKNNLLFNNYSINCY